MLGAKALLIIVEATKLMANAVTAKAVALAPAPNKIGAMIEPGI